MNLRFFCSHFYPKLETNEMHWEPSQPYCHCAGALRTRSWKADSSLHHFSWLPNNQSFQTRKETVLVFYEMAISLSKIISHFKAPPAEIHDQVQQQKWLEGATHQLAADMFLRHTSTKIPRRSVKTLGRICWMFHIQQIGFSPSMV